MKFTQELEIPKNQIDEAIKKEFKSLERKLKSAEKKIETRDNQIRKLKAEHHKQLAEAKRDATIKSMPPEFVGFLEILSKYIEISIEAEKERGW